MAQFKLIVLAASGLLSGSSSVGCEPPSTLHPILASTESSSVSSTAPQVSPSLKSSSAVLSPALDALLWPRLEDSSELKIMLVGDSTANCLGWGLRNLHSPGVSVELEAKDGCEILTETCGASSWAQKTKAIHPHVTFLFLGGAFLYSVNAQGRPHKSCTPLWDSTFESHLTQDLRELEAKGTRVWVVTVPYPLGVYDDQEHRREVDCINASIRKSASAVGDIGVLDLADHVCPRGACVRESSDMELRPDGVHFAIDALGPTARWVLEASAPNWFQPIQRSSTLRP